MTAQKLAARIAQEDLIAPMTEGAQIAEQLPPPPNDGMIVTFLEVEAISIDDLIGEDPWEDMQAEAEDELAREMNLGRQRRAGRQFFLQH